MKISVVIPSFQQGQFLEQTLQSVLGQEGPTEIIVQDGGSTDESVEILERYRTEIIYESKPDGGQASAINIGLKKATGDILCYLNSDDLWLPNTLANVRRAFTENRSASVIYGQAEFIDTKGKPFRDYPTEQFDYERLLETCFICQPACFWRKEVYEAHGGFDEKIQYNLDYEYWLRNGRQEKFLMIPQKWAQSRFHTDAKSVRAKSKIHLEALNILEGYSNGRPALSWMRGYARSLGDETDGDFAEYKKAYLKGLKEMQARYHLNMFESAAIWWKLRSSYKNKHRMQPKNRAL